MFTLELDWKRTNLQGQTIDMDILDINGNPPSIEGCSIVNIDLDALQSYIKSTYPSCVGMSADNKLKIHFESELSEQDAIDLKAYYKALQPSGYKSQAEIAAKIIELKEGILLKSLDQLTLVEKKILMNMPVNKAELFS